MLNKIAIAPLLCGCVAFLLGAKPGILERFIDEIEKLSRIISNSPHGFRKDSASIGLQRYWFVGVGIAFWIFGIYASVSGSR